MFCILFAYNSDIYNKRCGKLEEIIRIPTLELFRAALEAKMVTSCFHPKIHAANAGNSNYSTRIAQKLS